MHGLMNVKFSNKYNHNRGFIRQYSQKMVRETVVYVSCFLSAVRRFTMFYSYPCQELNCTEGNAATVYPLGAGVSPTLQSN